MFKKRREVAQYLSLSLCPSQVCTIISINLFRFPGKNKKEEREGKKVKEIHKINSLKLLWDYINTLFKNLWLFVANYSRSCYLTWLLRPFINHVPTLNKKNLHCSQISFLCPKKTILIPTSLPLPVCSTGNIFFLLFQSKPSLSVS